VICARGEAALEQAYRTLKAMGAEVLALPCDVSDQAQVNELVRHATRAFGRIDIVFYRLPSTVYLPTPLQLQLLPDSSADVDLTV